MVGTVHVAKTKALISCVIDLCLFLHNAESRFSRDSSHLTLRFQTTCI